MIDPASSARTRLILGNEAVETLQHSSVLLFGLGAVGGMCLETLARSGIGRFSLVDCDRIQASNFNRQILATSSTLGREKAQVARERVLDINPAAMVEAVVDFLDGTSVERYLDLRPDVVIDAIDSLGPKISLLCALHRRGQAHVSSMGAANKIDPTMVRVGDLSETKNCRLARFVRKRLSARGIHNGIRCVHSHELPGRASLPWHSLDSALDQEPSVQRGRERAVNGTLMTVTAVFGLLAASECLRLILGELRPQGLRCTPDGNGKGHANLEP